MPKSSNQKNYIITTSAALASAAIIPFGVSAGTAHLTLQAPHGVMANNMARAARGVMGTVSAINGTTLSVTAKNGTAYTVDASKATISEGLFGTGLTVSDIRTGDTVAI